MVVLQRFRLLEEWHFALSNKRITLRPAIFLSNSLSQDWNNTIVIQAFLLAPYVIPSLLRLTFLKQRGFGDLPITNGFIFLSVPSALVQSAKVNLSLSFFLPLRRTVASVVSGSRLKKDRIIR